ncbi:MAG TPA: O-methyltransferase [Polyangiaceae bacterium]|nr:O-methyltransferase [Polyangiaceae bacterium]
MSEERWTAVDGYFAEVLVGDEPALAAALSANAAAGLPAHDVSPVQGKLLHLLAKIQGARQILEIGTLGGYSTIWLARALPVGGRVTSLEIDAARAEVAKSNLERCGLTGVVDVRVGPALETLARLKSENAGPFDLIFIDADKPNNPHYLEWAVELSRPGTVIVGDNVVRGGAVSDSRSDDPHVVGVRAFVNALGRHPRLSATALQTVGVKGYDGFALAVVLPS